MTKRTLKERMRSPQELAGAPQDAAVLLASLDVVLKHSLQLFQDYQY